MTSRPAGAGEARRVAIEGFGPGVRDVLLAVDALLGPSGPAWVVGGAVRDALAGSRAADVDLVVPAGALDLGRALADRLGWPFVPLDEARGVCRVAGPVQVDVADFRAPDLAGDLAARDVTVNALAAPVRDLVASGQAAVEDPTGGLGDLSARLVRLCGPRALADDPVRMLRAVRMAAEPGWTLDPAAEAPARDAAHALGRVSAERIRDELIAIVSTPSTGRALRALDRLGALSVLLPESGPMRDTPQPEPHRFDVWEHSLRAVESMDEVAADLDRVEPWGEDLRAHLTAPLGDGADRAGVLKLAALLHDVAKPETRSVVDGRVRFIGHDVIGAERAAAIASRLRLSGRATDVLARLVAQHLRPMHLAQAGGITRRARYRFFRDLGDEARDLLLLSLADASAVRGSDPFAVWRGAAGDVLRALMDGLVEARAEARAPALVDGRDVMRELGIGPGPAVGRVLARLREEQAIGLVRTREQAMASIRRPLLDTPPTDPIQ